MSYAAVELAREIFGQLAKAVMVVGAGKMSEAAARHLHRCGASRILVTNRTEERAQEMARGFRRRGGAYDGFVAALPGVDIVIASSGAPHYIVTEGADEEGDRSAAQPARVRHRYRGAANMEPAVNELDNVFLYDIDDLQRVVTNNLERVNGRIAGQAMIIEEEWSR